MFKVLMLTADFYPENFGGIGIHTFKLVNNLIKLNVHVTVLVGRFDSIKKKKKTPNVPGLDIIEYELNYRNINHFYPSVWADSGSDFLEQILKEKNINFAEFDIIHLQDYYHILAAVGISEKYSLPIMTTIHSISPPKNHIVFFLRQYAIYNSRSIITVSNWMEKEIEAKYSISKKEIHVIPNGISLNNYLNNTDLFDDEIHILYLGRLSYLKGVNLLINEFSKIKTDKKLYLNIVGDGEQKDELIRLTKVLGLENYIIFHGYQQQNQIYEIARKCAFSVIPSIEEPFGIVALESMSYGLPVIASGVGGLIDIIQHEETGLLFDPTVEGTLLKEMNKLINNHILYAYIKERSLIHVKKYDWNNIAIETVRLYKEALEKNMIGKEKAYHYLW